MYYDQKKVNPVYYNLTQTKQSKYNKNKGVCQVLLYRIISNFLAIHDNTSAISTF